MHEILEEIKERLSIFQDLYTYIRVIEPVEKRAHMEINDEKEEIFTGHCYSFWESSKQCENCISMRALNNNKSAVKIELKGEKTYLIQAVPVLIKNKTYIVEMLKDITYEDIILSEKSGEVNFHEYVKQLNSRLIVDELTGIYNRRYVEERLPSDLYRAKVNNKDVIIVMADIDYFKNVNDSYGHLAGDCVLKKFASLIKESIRESTDWVARYGGEEFIIVLNNIDREKAIEVVEKIRKKTEEHLFLCDQNKIKITCSFGMNVVSETATYDIKGIIGPADDCLYEAKQRGRNQTIIK